MMNVRAANASHRQSERGNVLVYTVLSALFLFFAVGLGVDLSHLYLAKAELQNAADAAALAGASALTLPNPQRITTAVDRAVNTMDLNKYNFNNRSFADVMTVADQRALVRFAVNLSEFDNGGTGRSEATASADPVNIRFIKVTTPTVPISIIFANPLLGGSQSLSAKAVSGLSVPGNVRYCMAPLSAVAPDPGGTFPAYAAPTCPTAGIQHYTDGSPDCDPSWQFCKGCKYTMRYEGGTGPSGGNYDILACAGNGASAVRDALAAYGASCQCGNVSPGDTISTEPGVAAGPVAQGLNVRFDQYGQGGLSYSASVPPDKNIAQGASQGNGSNQTWDGIDWSQYQAGNPFAGPQQGHTGADNRRVLIIPIIAASQFTGGRTNVQVGSLGGFFMRSQATGANSDIQVEYIGNDLIGVVGFDPNGGGATNVVTPVLYR
jgi:Flp pilus assembly protein TadG